MQIIISCQHLELTENLRVHVDSKVARACEVVGTKPQRCNVHLNCAGGGNSVTIDMHTPGHTYQVTGTHASDMYQAIEAACAKLQTQLAKIGRKNKLHR